VLDSCMGSGTTAIACLNTGRNFIGFELDPECFQAAQQRLRASQSPPKSLATAMQANRPASENNCGGAI